MVAMIHWGLATALLFWGRGCLAQRGFAYCGCRLAFHFVILGLGAAAAEPQNSTCQMCVFCEDFTAPLERGANSGIITDGQKETLQCNLGTGYLGTSVGTRATRLSGYLSN